MFNKIGQQNNSSSGDGIAVSGNKNNVQQNNISPNNSSTLKWIIGTFIALLGVIIALLEYLK